jgi:hypothetical protein
VLGTLHIIIMGKIKDYIFPVRTTIFAAAPMQKVAGRLGADEKGSKRSSADGSVYSLESIEEIEITSKPKKNILDVVTEFAGSNWVFGTMMALIAAWVVMGFITGTTDR